MKIVQLICNYLNKKYSPDDHEFTVSKKNGSYNIFKKDDLIGSYSDYAKDEELNVMFVEELFSYDYMISDNVTYIDETYIKKIKNVILLYGMILNQRKYSNNILFTNNLHIYSDNSENILKRGEYSEIIIGEINQSLNLIIYLLPDKIEPNISLNYKFFKDDYVLIHVIINSLDEIYDLFLREIKLLLEYKTGKPFFKVTTEDVNQIIENKFIKKNTKYF